MTRFLRTSERLDEEMNRVDQLKVDQSKKVRRTPYESLMYSLVAEKKSKRVKVPPVSPSGKVSSDALA